jgi:CHAT domain-containing protein
MARFITCSCRMLFCLVMVSPSVYGQVTYSSPEDALQAGEVALKNGKIRPAEQAFDFALRSQNTRTRRIAYDRLLPIYQQIGRNDLVYSLGTEYLRWLKELNETKRSQEITLQLALSAMAIGQFPLAEARFKELDDNKSTYERFTPIEKILFWTVRARLSERRNDRPSTTNAWKQVEKLALTEIENRSLAVTDRERVEIVFRLSESYRFQQKPDEAIKQLLAIIPRCQLLDDARLLSRAYRLLGDHLREKKDFLQSETNFRLGLKELEKVNLKESLDYAEMLQDLSEILVIRKVRKGAEEYRDLAIKAYQTILQSSGPRENSFDVASAFWKLQQLYQRSQQFQNALRLTETAASLENIGRVEIRIKAEQGRLHILRGSFELARGKLVEAIQDLEKQKPLHLLELTRIKNSLAIVEQARGELDESKKLSENVLLVYREQELPTDLVLIETFNILGTNAALRGNQSDAIERFRQGIQACEEIGPKGDRQRSSLLINIALLHKAQGETDLALKRCSEAFVVLKQDAEPDELGLAAFQCAMAHLESERGRHNEAELLANQVLLTCKSLQIESGPLVTASLQCRAMALMNRRKTAEAKLVFQQIYSMQEKAKQVLWMPKTLFYLGLTEELEGHSEQAISFYQRAEELGKKGVKTYPGLRFSLSWRQAVLLAKTGKREESRKLLAEAIEQVEGARLRVFGDAQQRSAFFNQFIPGFEQMVEWSLADLQPRDAMLYAARGRSRSMLDQLQLSGVDPRMELTGEKGNALKLKEQEIRDRLASLRTRAQLIPSEAIDNPETKKLLDQIDASQEEYADTWREILNSSSLYRTLIDPEKKLQGLIQNPAKALGPNSVLLLYHLTREHGYIFALSTSDARIRVFPLEVSSELLNTIASYTKPRDKGSLIDGNRGIRIRPNVENEAPAKEPRPNELAKEVADRTIPVNLEAARYLIEYAREAIENPDSEKRSIRIRPKIDDGVAEKPLSSSEAITEALFPKALRQYLRQIEPNNLIIVPDGAVHKFPLEALCTESGIQKKYLVDEFPPTTYVPAIAALPILLDRAPSRAPLNLLTVADPAYPQSTPREMNQLSKRGTRTAIGLRGQLLPLPFTAEESKQIGSCFPEDAVISLIAEDATESNITKSIENRRIIHIAAHGFADTQFGNLFGALAVTPPSGAATSENDGFLSLFEIYRLNLKQCDLAVLSACETNVGPQRPLEAGVTLASAFLTSGARRVVASHWSVDDRSTSIFMNYFFREIVKKSNDGANDEYSKALHHARLKLRANPQYADPFYWAPFVLLGVPDR